MTFRDRVRRLRMFYKSGALFEERLANASSAHWLPWLPAQREVQFAFRSGRELRMKAGQWPDLPAACRLERAGFDFEFLPDRKRVRFDGLVFDSPLWARDEEEYYREVFRDDVYGIRGRDLAGCTVVDIGAFVGDTAVAFARAGARVHAFEPSAGLCGFFRQNAAQNGVADRVVLHEVGLGDKDRQLRRKGDCLTFVEGVSYTVANLPKNVEVLKIDCEGGEYHLLADPRFLAHLAPREIRLEYHHGPDGVVAPLERSGYAAEVAPRDAQFGLVQAMRT
jgi:FkbM family methyltransferase